jgi:hypothetical protein
MASFLFVLKNYEEKPVGQLCSLIVSAISPDQERQAAITTLRKIMNQADLEKTATVEVFCKQDNCERRNFMVYKSEIVPSPA